MEKEKMTSTIIDDACVFGGREGTIVVGGDSVTTVGSTEAKHAALKKAAELGIPNPGISDQSGAYPVDSEGNTIKEITSEDVAAYRNDFRVVSGM